MRSYAHERFKKLVILFSTFRNFDFTEKFLISCAVYEITFNENSSNWKFGIAFLTISKNASI